MAAKVRWGVIGAGGIAARRTIPEFKKMVSNAELVSVMDVSAERAEAVAKQFGIGHACTSEEELLAQPIDAVYIDYAAFTAKCPVTERVYRSESVWPPQNMFLGTEFDMDDMAGAIKKIWESKHEL